MPSAYQIQVIYLPTGEIASSWAPGDRAELDLEEAFCARLAAKGVGIVRTQAQVIAKAREAMQETLHDLKLRVKP